MYKKLLILPLSILVHFTLVAQTPTWSEKIAPILYKNCTNCHHAGGIAPFSLLTYQEANARHHSIEHAVTEGHMPPWPPDPKFREFVKQRVLTTDEITAIQTWANGGAPQGDPAKAPVAPTYSNAPVLANASLMFKMPTYKISQNQDIYRCFPMKSGQTVDKFITGIECIPGNGSIVHHVLFFQDQSTKCFELDAQDAAPGYTSFGGIGSNSAQLIGGWVPGSQPSIMPKGMGIKLSANANIVMQVHYAPGSVGLSDSTQLRLQLTEGTLRNMGVAPILNHALSLTNGPLFIPANTTKTINSQYVLPADVSFISISPHMHLIGHKMKVWAITPTGDSINLIKIDDWDFHWQGAYLFKKPVKLVKGTKLFGEAFYDNTSANEHNPNNPPKDVSLGEATTDEMMLVYFTFLGYQTGDENIDLEAATSTTSTQDVSLNKTPLLLSPNPAQSVLNLKFNLDVAEKVNIQVFDYQGIVLKNVVLNQPFVQGENIWQVPVSDLPKGIYWVKISSDRMYGVEGFVKGE
jgi:Secretion system C-terminal sorting domain/Copper type II ascorbate-dependent monooxygenase, N-terminal domain/Copper type II ascorbate-dependent monooxygenase, C-terminal domain